MIISRPCFFANFVSSGTRAIVPSSFMISQMTPAGLETGDARQVHRRLGVPGAHQHAAVARAQRKHVARARQVARLGRRVRSPPCTVRARSAAEMPVLVPSCASIDTQNAVSRREALLLTSSGISSCVEPLGRHRQADQAAPVLRHEVDRLRRHLRRRHRQVALVLAILVVDDDDHAAGADGVDGVLDRGERAAPAGALGDADLRVLLVIAARAG